MPLPIPDIMERAAAVLEAAKSVLEKSEEETLEISVLRLSLQKVAPADLLAVMNEVGKVYVGIHNIQITSVGCRPIVEKKVIEMALNVEYGLGPRTLVLPMPFDMAKNVVKNFNDALAIITTGINGGLITILDPTQINGQS